MASVFNVAAYILHKKGQMTAMKLQKLVYYSQAWSLVWDEKPLFGERIEAWANGPVTPDLFVAHRGEFSVSKETNGNRRKLTRDEKETIDAVLDTYGDKSAAWLSDLTHREDPWRDARRGIQDGVRSNAEITHGAMADYYGNL
ncbi:MAG: type II toxin-antitoxin system antitoxin SocA domain-containing protein [Pseudomonadota bacterium]